MDYTTCKVVDLKAEAKSRGLRGYSKLRKAELIDFLKQSESSSDNRKKDLIKICKERNIKYATRMTKQEMIEVLKWNDEDPSVNVHPDAQKRVAKYQNKFRDNPEQREKAKECSRKWRINNPEKARGHLIKWQESLFQ